MNPIHVEGRVLAGEEPTIVDGRPGETAELVAAIRAEMAVGLQSGGWSVEASGNFTHAIVRPAQTGEEDREEDGGLTVFTVFKTRAAADAFAASCVPAN